jgi:peptidoglycan/LPS O-acetylase OafA/YrhL
MRAAAIIFVLLYHASFYFDRCNANWFFMCYKYLILDGVSIFFVLSGFLIGGILIRTINKQDFKFAYIKEFWLKRWFRTIPSYMLVLLLNFILYILIFNWPHSGLHLYPFFLQNFNTTVPVFFAESWSLSIEEWFYLLIPFIMFGLAAITPKYKKKIMFTAIWTTICVVTVARLYKSSLHPVDIKWYIANIGIVVTMRLDSLMYGVLAAYLYYYYAEHFYKYKKVLFIVGFITVYIVAFFHIKIENYTFIYYWRYTIEPICFMLLLPLLNSINTGKGWVCKSITFISIISYSLYLIHSGLLMNGILPYLFKAIHLDYTQGLFYALISWTIALSVSIMLSYCLYKYYEKPVTELRERFVKK